MVHTHPNSYLGNLEIEYFITTLKPKSFWFSLYDYPFFNYLGNFRRCCELVNILSLLETDISEILAIRAKLGVGEKKVNCRLEE